MSQAGRTGYFARSTTRARSARRGEEKNKLFSSPRLALRARVVLRAKYRVHPACLIKRLSCRLHKSHKHNFLRRHPQMDRSIFASYGMHPLNYFASLGIIMRQGRTTQRYQKHSSLPTQAPTSMQAPSLNNL